MPPSYNHEVTYGVPQAKTQVFEVGLRAARRILQGAGGYSRVTTKPYVRGRGGLVYAVAYKGPIPAVSHFRSNLTKLYLNTMLGHVQDLINVPGAFRGQGN